jgi:uncharacterized membrane protein
VAGKSKKSIPSTGQQPASRAESDDQHRDQVRADKRAQFESSGKNKRLGLIAGAVVLVAVALVAAAVAMSGGDEATPAPQAPVAAGSESVGIPVAEVSDGKAHFYSYDAGGTAVDYFVVKSSDGEIRAALDACDVCYPQKKGYHQEGDVMVCNNCGRRFPSTEINVQDGGCNPSPLERSVEGDQLVISVADLQAGATYFQ